jgi:hypothetical protein
MTAKGAGVGRFRVPPSQALAILDSLPTLAGWVIRNIGEDEHAIDASEIEDARERLGKIKEPREILDGDAVEDANTKAGTVVKAYANGSVPATCRASS